MNLQCEKIICCLAAVDFGHTFISNSVPATESHNTVLLLAFFNRPIFWALLQVKPDLP